MKNRIKKILIGIGIAVILVAALITIKDEVFYWSFSDSSTGEDVQTSFCSEDDNVALVKIHGGIVNYKIDTIDSLGPEYADTASSEDIVSVLESAENDDAIKAIIVEIDSTGGLLSAGEEIMTQLKKSSKPVAAVIRDYGTSAAYLIATGADRIYASKFSNVGSIGVTMSYLDSSQKNESEGLIYQQLSSAKFKDSGDPNKPLSAEEKKMFMRDVEKMHQIFLEYVAQNRNMDANAVEKLADGSTLVGEDAKAAGLVDEIGDIDSAKEWLGQELQIEPVVCIF